MEINKIILKDLGIDEKSLPSIIAAMDDASRAMFLELVGQKKDHYEKNSIETFIPYDYQREFFKAGKNFKSRLLCAANRIGKTHCGGAEMTYHLTGNYPDWWEGRVFDSPILGWCLGITGDSTRRVLQKELFGTEDCRMEALMGTGSIPREAIISLEKEGPIIKSAKIKYCPNKPFSEWVNSRSEISTVEFRSTEQGEHTLMGPAVHVIWTDEEHPRHSQSLFGQCIARTATTDGVVYITATPENGLTPLIDQFQEEDTMYFQTATWDDAEHMTEEIKAELLLNIPEYQREMRSLGLPILGEGLVYPVAQKDYQCEPFEIPKHFRQLGGLDFGYIHPNVFTRAAYDVENDIIYITTQFGWVEKTPQQVAPGLNAMAGNLQIVWPHDGNTDSKDTGIALADRYKALGCNLVHTHFTNPSGSISVEEGVIEILERMRDGRFKVFSHCTDFFKGAARYQRKNGKINKNAFDFDYGDSARYVAMSIIQGMGRTGIDLMKPNINGWLSEREGMYGAGSYEGYLSTGMTYDY